MATLKNQYSWPPLPRILMGAVIFLFLGAQQIVDGLPLVFPNKFSFQKTTPSTTTTEAPELNHDQLDNSISYLGKGYGASSESTSSARAFRIGIFVCICCVIFVMYLLYRRCKFLITQNSTEGTHYVFPGSNDGTKLDDEGGDTTKMTE